MTTTFVDLTITSAITYIDWAPFRDHWVEGHMGGGWACGSFDAVRVTHGTATTALGLRVPVTSCSEDDHSWSVGDLIRQILVRSIDRRPSVDDIPF